MRALEPKTPRASGCAPFWRSRAVWEEGLVTSETGLFLFAGAAWVETILAPEEAADLHADESLFQKGIRLYKG